VRVGLVCPYSLTLPGGVQGQVLGLARVLRGMGHEARVLAPCDGPPPDAFVTPLGNSIPFAANGSVAPLAPDLSAALRTITALRDEDFDVLHLHEPFAPGPTHYAVIMKTAPLVGTFHAAGVSAAYRLAGWLLGRIANRLDARCVVSEDARRLAEWGLGGEYQMLFNGIEIDRFAKAEPWPTAGPTIFFLGRHEQRKGLAVLLEAMRHLPGDVRLWAGGDGPETDALQAQAGDDPRIEWLGRIGDDERSRRLRGADVYCAPSLGGESFGVVLLEAMAARTPIVASDLPGYRNVARPDQDALLVEPGDAAALAAAIERVLVSPSLAEELATSGEARATEFSMEHLAERYLEIYADVITQNA